MDELNRLLHDTEAEIFNALRALAEIENADIVRAAPQLRTGYATALSHLVQAQGQLARLHEQVGALTVETDG